MNLRRSCHTQRGGSSGVILGAALSSILLFNTTDAADVVRGPYLQVGTPSSITVRWRTSEPTGSVVFYGLDPSFLYQVTGNLEPVTDHEVTLHGMTASTRYYYSVGTLFEPLASGPDFSFVTAPVSGARVPIRIWAIGDCGTKGLDPDEHQEQVRDAFQTWAQHRPADLWLALGDNAYFAGEDAEYQSQFFDVYPRMLRSTVLWPTLGNHETYSFDDNGGFPYFRMFTLPTKGEAGGVPSGTERYYSFDYGNIHFVSLDSEMEESKAPGAMLDWLRTDLSAHSSDWVIAYWHTPPYSKGSHDSDTEGNLIWMRSFVAPILESHNVDLVLCGHSHIYERSYLLHGHYGTSTTLEPSMVLDSGNGRPDDTGAYYKMTSGPDAQLGTVYVVAGSSGWATFRRGHHPAMVTDQLETGSLVIDVEGDRLDLQFLRETGAVDDSFTIVKGQDSEPLRLQKILTKPAQVDVLFRSIAGHTYQVETSSTLEPGDWKPASDVLEANNAATRITVPRPRGLTTAFFRVVDLSLPQ